MYTCICVEERNRIVKYLSVKASKPMRKRFTECNRCSPEQDKNVNAVDVHLEVYNIMMIKRFICICFI